ncbi:CRISPR-associated endonuclease Cas3'' [Enterococcus rivorum]|uniref:CRISPR-associated endonuclease Cas3 n=1 Tax=Enterococcus rivorum TaxID=762845 RepID=A0A1E5KX85_9ENTE|nr:CRISPR-associated endonuclease Cas3'' [Enterococcus rivorum]MBP2100002.1 CRISPR-associated endonuclease Cas3-HD [Enterococcus rivorum]OEH82472.1 CRISPR-associated endonuclease Cas3'' [Enterococcus rivorum]
MNQYLAKSSGQTIAEHTQDLLANFQLLKEIYPSIRVNWDLLYLACCYHDLGKMNLAFQNKLLPNGKRDPKEIPHGLLSTAFIPVKSLKKIYSKVELRVLAHAVAFHHVRNFSTISEEDLEEQVGKMKIEAENFSCDFIEEIQVKILSKKYVTFENCIYGEVNQEEADSYLMVKGLLNRIDYAASGGIVVEQPNDFLLADMNQLLEKWQTRTEAKWNELQLFMLEHQNENVVVVAQTGEGKTEAGLLWLGNNKGFFTLPLRTAINAIYTRLKEEVFTENFTQKIGLLHSETYGQYLAMEGNSNETEEYYTRTKQMTLPLTICTIDQLFDLVFRYDGFEAKLATLLSN